MDGLSVAASIIGVIQLAGSIAKLCGGYIQDVKDASADIIALRQAINGLISVLENLAAILNNPNSGLGITLVLKDDIRTCLLTLEALEGKVGMGKGKKAMKRLGLRALKWPLKRSEVEKVMGDIERYKSSFSLSLQVDQMWVLAALLGIPRDVNKADSVHLSGQS